MNRLAKGAIATGIGVVLLMGGGGTFALWTASTPLTNSGVTAGDLRIASTVETWTSSVTGNPIDVASYRIVPGETLTYRARITVTAVGDELTAVATAPTSTDVTHSNATQDVALAAALNISAPTISKVSGAGLTVTGQNIAVASGGGVVDVAVTVAFPLNAADTVADESGDDAAKNGVVNLAGFSITFTQTTPA